jgi:hypothetical protein
LCMKETDSTYNPGFGRVYWAPCGFFWNRSIILRRHTVFDQFRPACGS